MTTLYQSHNLNPQPLNLDTTLIQNSPHHLNPQLPTLDTTLIHNYLPLQNVTMPNNVTPNNNF